MILFTLDMSVFCGLLDPLPVMYGACRGDTKVFGNTSYKCNEYRDSCNEGRLPSQSTVGTATLSELGGY